MSKEDDTRLVWCAQSEPHKNARRGSMLECAERRKIYYYGVKKADSKTLELGKSKARKNKSSTDLRAKESGIRSKMKKLLGYIKVERNATKKKTMQDEYDKLHKEQKNLVSQIKAKEEKKEKKQKRVKKKE